ncbi:MAG: hypothetical protein M1358_11730 [Chloroflexi bacterium]|nr:hypothetical protein [Chloroflexota bacterium]
MLLVGSKGLAVMPRAAMFREILRTCSSKALDLILTAALLPLSFYLTFVSGERGFFPFDQSIIFDGSYRVLSGQVPYKDFFTPWGPVVFWLHALFFEFFGINYSSYILGAAVVNVLSTLCSISMLKLLFPRSRFLPYIAGLLTAVWFYPPSGTPWPEQTSFFFSFVAMTILLYSVLSREPFAIRDGSLSFVSGGFALLSFLSKQNSGSFILPLYVLMFIMAYSPDWRRIIRSCAVFFAGFLLGAAMFFLWVWLNADVKTFLEYFVELPSGVGASRLSRDWLSLLVTFFVGGELTSSISLSFVRIFLAAMLAIALFALVGCFRSSEKARGTWRRELLAGTMCVYFILFQNLFILSTANEAENGFPFVGVISAIGIGLSWRLVDIAVMRCKPRLRSRSILSLALPIGVTLSALAILGLGGRVLMNRTVQDTFRGSTFPQYSSIDGLERLRWGQPTIIRAAKVKEDDVKNVIEYLRTRNKNFFVFPDFTVFYALLKVRSPQPVLWFHKGLTYPTIYSPDLDRRIVDDLVKNEVEIIVLEEDSWFSTYGRLDDFPQLESYISEGFDKAEQIGLFSIYEKRNQEQ